MHRRRLLAIAGSLVASSAVAWARRARADTLDDALADVAKARAKITTVQGPFSQERSISLLASTVKSTGTMWLQRPDRLRWELDPPDATVYWVLPEGLAYKSKSGSGKVANGAQGPLGGLLGDLLVLLGGDLTLLKGRYDLVLVKRDAKSLILWAVPKDKALAKTTKKVELELGGDLVALKRVVIHESGSDKSVITFGALEHGRTIDPKLLTGP